MTTKLKEVDVVAWWAWAGLAAILAKETDRGGPQSGRASSARRHAQHRKTNFAVPRHPRRSALRVAQTDLMQNPGRKTR